MSKPKINYDLMDSIEKGAKLGKSKTVRPNKVYCCNCKWYKDFREFGGYIPNPDRCSHPEFSTYSNCAVFPDNKEYAICKNHNTVNNCKYYERKWWKFWVK